MLAQYMLSLCSSICHNSRCSVETAKCGILETGHAIAEGLKYFDAQDLGEVRVGLLPSGCRWSSLKSDFSANNSLQLENDSR